MKYQATYVTVYNRFNTHYSEPLSTDIQIRTFKLTETIPTDLWDGNYYLILSKLELKAGED